MAVLLIGAGLVLFGAGVLLKTKEDRSRRRVPCVDSHSEDGLNYPWLRGVHGGLAYIEYEEPVGSGNWRRYTRRVWEAHCRVVSHNPATLVAAHVRAFVDPRTRFAVLRFHFRNGVVMEPTAYFYELEAGWIQRYGR
jgi:hypothetical protein